MIDVTGWSVWDLIKHISERHEMLEWSKISKIYEPWIINRAFQADLEVLDKWIINMNRFANMPKEVQYKVLQKSVPKKKRYLKYLKDSKYSRDIQAFASWFNISEETMKYYLHYLSEDKKKEILLKIKRYEEMKNGYVQSRRKKP